VKLGLGVVTEKTVVLRIH